MFQNTLKEILKGWIIANAARTQAFLGERNYIGMSDVGKAFGCLRQAVASKAFPNPFYPSLDEVEGMDDETVLRAFERIRPLERGHEQETGIVSALDALGFASVGQLEIKIEHKGVPVAAHLDHTLFGNGVIHVIESKSNENIPDPLYNAYTGQIYGQVGLMERYFFEPVFAARDDNGALIMADVTMPEVIKEVVGRKCTSLPPITGEVLSMSGRTARSFGPYQPNKMMTDLVLQKAKYVWETAKKVLAGEMELDRVEFEKGFYPLCDFCGYNYSCPKFSNVSQCSLAFNGPIHQLKEYQGQQKELDAKIKLVKGDLAGAYDELDMNGAEWIETEDFRFRNASRSRTTLNKNKLAEELQAVYGFPQDSIDVLFQACSKTTEFKQLDVGKVNRPKSEAA